MALARGAERRITPPIIFLRSPFSGTLSSTPVCPFSSLFPASPAARGSFVLNTIYEKYCIPPFAEYISRNPRIGSGFYHVLIAVTRGVRRAAHWNACPSDIVTLFSCLVSCEDNQTATQNTSRKASFFCSVFFEKGFGVAAESRHRRRSGEHGHEREPLIAEGTCGW